MKKIIIVLMVCCGINAMAMELLNRGELDDQEMPTYSLVDALNRATAGDDKKYEKYAQIAAKRAISEKTLEELRRSSDHWLTNLNAEAKALVYRHMPKTTQWRDKCTIPYEGDPGVITFAPRSSKVTVVEKTGKKVDVLDVESQKLLHAYKCKSWDDYEDGRVLSARLSSDDTKIAIASENKTAVVADVQTGNVLRTVEHVSGVYSATFGSNDRELISLSRGSVRRVTDIVSGQIISRVRYFDKMPEVDLDTISPDGTMLVIREGGQCSKFGLVGDQCGIVDANTGKLIHSIGAPLYCGKTEPVFSSDSTKVVAICSAEQKSTRNFEYDPTLIKIINLAKTPIAERILEYDSDDNHFYENSINFSPDGTSLAINRGNGLLDIVDTDSGLVEASLKVCNCFAASAAFSSDNSTLAVGFPKEIKVFRAIQAKTLDQALFIHLEKYCAEKKLSVLPKSFPWVNRVLENLYN